MQFLSVQSLPIYNGEDFIEECIKSMSLQSFSDLELIIIDDGSVDNTLFLIKKYKETTASILSTQRKKSLISTRQGLFLYF